MAFSLSVCVHKDSSGIPKGLYKGEVRGEKKNGWFANPSRRLPSGLIPCAMLAHKDDVTQVGICLPDCHSCKMFW
jgi:hypothetical protein